MPNVLNPRGHFEPIHAAHAIEQVAFVLRMEQPLEEASFALAREAVKQFKNESDLPGQAEVKTLAFAFGPVGQPSQHPSQFLSQPSPIVLNRMAADGTPEKELRIDHDSITFKTLRYTRWEAAWLQARKYFEIMVPIYAANMKIAGISLNYVDKFKWVGNPTECRMSLLLHPSSIYLCPHIFEAEDFWHSHTGAFLRADEYTKRLLRSCK